MGAQAHEPDVLRAQQYGLPPVVRGPAVLGCSVHVPLGDVVQLPNTRILDAVALLLRGLVEDAERLDQRLLQDVGGRRPAEEAEVARGAQLAEAGDFELVPGNRSLELAELGQVQNVLRPRPFGCRP